jgi:uncharacterized protein YndB with AHSA1/START domain
MDLTIMETTSVIHNTFVVERTYPAPPERVFAAFAEPEKKRVWFAESHSHTVEIFEMDFRIGGTERASYRFGEGTPFPGVLLTNDTYYQDIVPNRRIVMASSMAIAGKPISAALTTFEFLPAAAGTDLLFTHQAAFFEGADGPQMREAGWRKLLEQLDRDIKR